MQDFKISQAVIIAGGRGERLRPFTDTMPKAMYPVGDGPFIEKLIYQIKSFGINDIVILLGYLPEKITEYLGDGSKYGIHITYDITDVNNDTAERIYHAKDLYNDIFLFMYCDNYCPIDFDRLVSDSIKNDAIIQVSVYSNKDKYTKDNMYIDDKGLVRVYDKTHKDEKLSGVDIGYEIVKKEVVDLVKNEAGGFNNIVFHKLIKENKLYATITDHRYYSVSTIERMPLTLEFFKPKKIVFIDRDGTINEKPPKACYIEKVEDFKWLPKAKDAIKLLNDNGYKVILITNQPGIARNKLTLDTLNDIHNKMQNDLNEIGAKIEKIYYCPHDWDEGCDCRKPKPGMLYNAQRDFSIDLTKTVLFGDDERDIEAANKANVKGILVSNEYSFYDAVVDFLGENK